MARRCGGAGTCTCAVTGGSGISVGGTGSLEDPYKVSFIGGGTSCDLIMDCVGANIGSGLSYDPVGRTLAVKISTAPGNTITIGADQGIYSSGGGGGGTSGGVTVAGLAASNLIGAYRGGWAQFPKDAVGAYRMARDNQVPIATMPVRALQDGTLVALQESDMSSVIGVSGPVDNQWGARYKNGRYNAWNWFRWDQPDWVPSDSTTSRNRQDPIPCPTVEDIFSAVGNRMVLVTRLMANTNSAVTLLKSTIARYGMNQSVIVSSQTLSDLTTFVTDGIATGIWIDTAGNASANPPATVYAAGVRWAFINKSIADATITSYISAGLSVMVYSVERQYYRTKYVSTLGCRGVLSGDPVYTAAVTSKYRRTSNLYTSGTGGWPLAPEHGRISSAMESSQDTSAASRGDMDGSFDYWFLPSGSSQGVLMGEQCPIATPTNYTLRQWFRFNNDPSAWYPWIGVTFASPQDHDFRATGDPSPTALDTFYTAVMHFDGSFQLFRTNGLSGETDIAPGSTRWKQAAGNATVNTWYTLEIIVTPTNMTFRNLSNATPTFMTSTDTTHRGPYFGVKKQEYGLTFTAGFRNTEIV